MAVEVKMPQLGESVHEGTIGRWLKAEGDTVEKYEPLLEVITDKVDTEVTAVDSGTVLKIVVPEGETVTVGTVLAMIGEAGEDVGDVAPAASAGTVAEDEDEATPEPAAETAASEGGAQELPAATGEQGAAAAGATQASPVAARMAAEHGVDLTRVSGSGRGGQITRQDVERHIAQPPARPEPTDNGADLGFISPRVARIAATNGVDLRRVTGTGRDGRITARDVEQFIAEGGASPAPAEARRAAPPPRSGVQRGELVKLSPMRAAIAEHMVRSKHTSPHVTTVHEADMSGVLAAHRALRDDFRAQGVRLTLTAFIVRSLTEALAAHPIVNSSWTDEGVQVYEDINIGMAVAVEQGLIVPVIRHADELSLRGLARTINDLAERARNKGLSPDDVQGGTFTLTNYGTLGSLFGTPVINQPQAAILGTGAIRKQPVVIEGPEGDSLGIRPTMLVSLTFDHRILDGGSADPFMQDLVQRLEHTTA